METTSVGCVGNGSSGGPGHSMHWQSVSRERGCTESGVVAWRRGGGVARGETRGYCMGPDRRGWIVDGQAASEPEGTQHTNSRSRRERGVLAFY